MAGYSKLLVAASLLAFPAAAVASDIAVRGERIYPVTGAPIDNGVVIIRDGRIAAVGAADDVTVPEGVTVIEAAVVTPGLIDAHTVVGLAGYLNQAHDQDQIERSEAIQPELRAIDAYNTGWLRECGVTTYRTWSRRNYFRADTDRKDHRRYDSRSGFRAGGNGRCNPG